MVLEFNLPCSPEFVFQCLSNMDRFCTFHPIIQKIEALGDDNYRVYEEIPIGPITYAFKYNAHVLSDATTKTIDIVAVVQRVTKINMRFELIERDSGVYIREIVAVKSPLPIRGIFFKLLRKQHALLFHNIELACK
jgi:carbon monoxide dehydrogenase subunit G